MAEPGEAKVIPGQLKQSVTDVVRCLSGRSCPVSSNDRNMIRKTILLAGVTAALMTAAPALAQDAPAAATAPSAQAQGSIQLQPGSSVKGSDGTVLGTLEGVQSNAAGEQELTVRGADGDLRGVPLGGLTQQGADVVVGISSAEFNPAPVVEEPALAAADGMAPTPSAPTAEPAPAPQEPTTDGTGEADGATPPTPQG